MKSTARKISAWLNKKFDSRENGIFLDTCDFGSFEQILNFIEAKDRPVKTPAIYYQAFADENLAEFLDILEEELRSKLGYNRSESCPTMRELIATAELKTVVIDLSYLYTLETIDKLWKWLKEYQVGLILICSQANVRASQIPNHPVISQWEQFVASANLPRALSNC